MQIPVVSDVAGGNFQKWCGYSMKAFINMADISTPCHIENENYIYHLYNKNKKMYVIFYFISNLILMTMLVVYLILFDFD